MKQAFKELKEAIEMPRAKDKTKLIKAKLKAFEEEFNKPWWKRLYKK